MKTPRLALALLALALTPFANAATLPTWTVVEEGSRAWPEIRFSVGGKPRALHCRYAECGPKAPKGQINLFLITKKGPGVPTKVTIYKGVQRGRWNPRRWTDGEWAYEPEVIAAMAYPWESELSHFKLDNTGPTLFVVQGKERYPATSDIDEAQYNSYDQMKIAPPKKMLDDELKPAAPPVQRSTWWCNQETGDIIQVVPGGKPPEGYTRLESRSSTCGKKPAGPARPGRTLSKLPSAGKWKDAITPVGEWRAIQTSAWPLLGIPVPMPTMTFYCYHEKMDGDKDLATHLKKHPLIVECVNWSAPTDDATKEEGGKKFKLRNNHIQFDLGFTNGKLQTLSGVKGVTVRELTALPDTLGGEKFVKVAAPQAAPAEGASLALVAGDETRWLTKPQAAAYADARAAAKDDAARKALDDRYRALVAEQIRPEAAAAYKSAHAAPAAEAAAKIKAAIGGVEMWGGKDLKAIVAPFQEKADPATAKLLEIQLSKADWELLKKKPEAMQAYMASRLSANGASGDGTAFDANYLDPVALRLGAEAARKAVGSGQTAPNPGDETLVPLLTEDEKKLLTPSELKNYNSIYDSAPAPKEKDKNLQAEAKRLRELIASEGRGKAPAYKAPGSLEEFNKLPEWQRKKFCDDLVASNANLAADTRGAELGGGSSRDAKSQLLATDANSATAGNTTAAAQTSAPAWAVDACKPYSAPPVTTNPGGSRPPVGGVIPTPPHGADAEAKPKEKSKWLTQDLLTSAAKGAMVGLLVGSLFGPVGLVAGPLLGAAMFYGLTKITS